MPAAPVAAPTTPEREEEEEEMAAMKNTNSMIEIGEAEETA